MLRRRERSHVPKAEVAATVRNERGLKLRCRTRHPADQELVSYPSENLLNRRGRRYVKGFIEDLTQLVGAVD